jgi:hypothetical protein
MPLSLSVAGERVEVEPGEVRRRLALRWADHRRSFRTSAELAASFPVPRGRARDTLSHEPLANLFPAVYGIGPSGLPRSAEGHGQARQLLGYLSLFERVIVDYLDRLSNLRPLLTPDGMDDSTFGRPLAEALPRLAPILHDGGPDADALYGRSVLPEPQQGRILDFLLALYGEEPGALIPRSRGAAAEAHERDVKRAILAELARTDGRHGRGFDYLRKGPRRRSSGLERRARLLLGASVEPVKRRRPRLGVLEHCLLRPRSPPEPDGAPDPMVVSVVIHPGEPDRSDAAWRRRAGEMIRALTPAHIEVRVCFVDRPRWIRFKRLHSLWREALRDGFDDATDLLSRDLMQFLAEQDEEGCHD